MGEFSDFLLAAGFERAGEIAPPPAARALIAFAARHRIDLRRLVERRSRAALLNALPEKIAARLLRKMHALALSRIQTGFGSLRRSRSSRRRIPESLLRRALARVQARPAYFLWRRP
jgi:hypothetical protein